VAHCFLFTNIAYHLEIKSLMSQCNFTSSEEIRECISKQYSQNLESHQQLPCWDKVYDKLRHVDISKIIKPIAEEIEPLLKNVTSDPKDLATKIAIASVSELVKNGSTHIMDTLFYDHDKAKGHIRKSTIMAGKSKPEDLAHSAIYASVAHQSGDHFISPKKHSDNPSLYIAKIDPKHKIHTIIYKSIAPLLPQGLEDTDIPAKIAHVIIKHAVMPAIQKFYHK